MSNGNTRNIYPASSVQNLVQAMGLATWLLLVLLLGLTFDSTFGFNFDQRAPVVFTGPSGSLFGFSVAQHRDANTDWVLIGAPKASTAQPDVEEGGAVYKCPVVPLGNLANCEQVPFDTDGQEPRTNKSHQWFGATVETSGPDGKIVACAPRLVWYRDVSLADNLREPTGTCFVGTSDFGQFEEYSPCQTESGVTGFRGVTHCLGGFSAQITEDENTLIIGTPGSYFLQGQLYAQSLLSRSNILNTSEESLTSFDNSYRGFSLALGDFNGDGVDDYVTGTPRGSSLNGLVTIFDNRLSDTPLIEVTGEQLVSYFGNSVEAVDVNGDGLDDLIVGAPMHTDKTSTIEKWEAGQIYVYLQTPAHGLGDPVKITGQATRARFGYSLASIGDANQDGFNDIAVGAPFDGEDQSGLVYIFHGSASGLTQSQIISPASLGRPMMTSFGFSLQGGQDMDGNNYPDLLVGAESSDQAVLIRTRPVVLLEAELTLDPIGINLDNKTLRLVDGSMVTGFLVVPCLTYTGNHLPSEIAITYTLTLDSRVGSASRAKLVGGQSTKTSNRQLQEGEQFCDSQQAYVENTIQDKLTPIAVTLNYELNPDESSLGPTDILPILNMNAVSSQTKQVFIQNNCANNVCIPDLAVRATSSRSVVVGKGDDLTLDVTVDNNGEDAFQSTLDVYYPEGLQYVRLERTSQMDLSVACTDDPDTRIISCDTGNPLSGRYRLEFGLTLSTSGITGNRQTLEFYMIARSENSEDGTLENNEYNITVNVAVQVNLKLLSASDPELVTYEVNEDGSIPPLPSNASEKDIGPAITHTYEVRNAGPSKAGRIEMDISWPQKDDAGEYLFYLLGLNAADGMTCSFTQGEPNPERLHLEQATLSQLTTTTSSRRRREAAAAAAAAPVAQSQTQSEPIYCIGESCVKIHCTVDQLLADESKVVRLLGRVWSRTFMQLPDAASQILTVASSASANVREVPYNISYTPGEFNDTRKASTTVSSEELQAPPASIAWWIILVSVLGGLILLLIIILGLWKCGFFERKKPGEEEKKSQYQAVAPAPATSAPEKTGIDSDEV